MNLLQIVQATCGELGLNQPTNVIASSDLQIQQLLALANRDGNELWRVRDWTFLQKEYIINLAEPITVVGDVTENSSTITNVSSVAGLSPQIFAVQCDGAPQAQRISGASNAIGVTTVECEMEFTATAVQTEIQFLQDTYNLPDDFSHYITNTWWDRTNHWMLIGPQSPQFDQWQRSGIVTTGPRRRWRQIGQQPTAYRIWPPPTAEDVPAALVFEYVSSGWIETVGRTYISQYAADTDVPLFDPQMHIQGIKWRFLQAKGMNYGDIQAEYVDFVQRAKARDGGMPDLSLTRRKFPYLITSANVQDGNFPGP